MLRKTLLLTLLVLGGLRPGFGQEAARYPFRDTTLTLDQRLDDLIGRMTLEEKIDLLAGYRDFYLHPCERLGIPAFTMADGPLGVSSWGIWGRATAFPSALSLASSWNRSLAAETGRLYAEEWRARGLHFMLAPGVNIYRASKGARNFEYFGEDPYLTSEMVVPFIRSVQDGGVIATIKHFAGNDQEFDRYRVSTEVSERALREIYLPPFRAAVQRAGVRAVMTGYNPLNGIFCTENKHLIDILRKEWGFRGILMSDWACTYSAERAANHGLDLEMGSYLCFTRDQLLPLIDSGIVTRATIDEKVRHIYGTCMEMGFFDRPQRDSTLPAFNPQANRQALKSAEEGIILLKNDRSLLPLAAPRTIAVIGPTANPPIVNDRIHTADNVVYGGGGSSRVHPWYVVTDLEGIRTEFPEATVYYSEGISNQFKPRLFANSRFRTRTGAPGLEARYYTCAPTAAADDPTGRLMQQQAVAAGQQVASGNQPGGAVVPADTLLAERIDARVNNEWWGAPLGDSRFGDDYRIEWEGYIDADRTDSLRIFVDAQGGYRLWVNGTLRLDAWESQSFDKRDCALAVRQGDSTLVRLEYRSQRALPAEIRMGYTYDSEIDFSEAKRLAAAADVVVLCVGLDGTIELEGRDRPFELPFGQDQLIREVTAVNPNAVVVIHAGGGIRMTPWIDRVPTVLHAFYAGQEGGNALAHILSGRVNPSAKLPFTIERQWSDSPACGNYDETRRERKVYYREGIFTGYRGYDKQGTTPLFPFGHGLSYTTFEYGTPTVEILDPKEAEVQITLPVRNTGKRYGGEVVQLYVGDPVSKEERPIQELKGFEKVWLKPGESKTVTFRLNRESFQYFSEKLNAWTFEPGEFRLRIGASSRDIRQEATLKLR